MTEPFQPTEEEAAQYAREAAATVNHLLVMSAGARAVRDFWARLMTNVTLTIVMLTGCVIAATGAIVSLSAETWIPVQTWDAVNAADLLNVTGIAIFVIGAGVAIYVASVLFWGGTKVRR